MILPQKELEISSLYSNLESINASAQSRIKSLLCNISLNGEGDNLEFSGEIAVDVLRSIAQALNYSVLLKVDGWIDFMDNEFIIKILPHFVSNDTLHAEVWNHRGALHKFSISLTNLIVEVRSLLSRILTSIDGLDKEYNLLQDILRIDFLPKNYLYLDQFMKDLE